MIISAQPPKVDEIRTLSGHKPSPCIPRCLAAVRSSTVSSSTMETPLPSQLAHFRTTAQAGSNSDIVSSQMPCPKNAIPGEPFQKRVPKTTSKYTSVNEKAAVFISSFQLSPTGTVFFWQGKKVLEFRLSATGLVGSQFCSDKKKKSLGISGKSNRQSGEPVWL